MRELGHELQPLEEVREAILSHIDALPAETCPLRQAHGRVLRQDIVARDLLPPFDNSAMDGYAVRVGDLAGASDDRPVTLPVRGTVQAGDVQGGVLAAGTSVRIMTGAPMPPGAEAVVPHELTTFTDESVTFIKPVLAARNVRPAGGDVKPGDVPFTAGRRIHSAGVAIAGALGFADVEVARSPRIGIISPGDELVDISETPGPGKIRNSNEPSIAAALLEVGATPVRLGIVEDSLDVLRRVIRRGVAEGLDGLVSTGGVSAGDFDFVQAVVREDARPGFVFKVAMRPGKPQVFGLFDGVPLFGLPGNPAAAANSIEVFVRPALRKMLGFERVLPETFGVRFPFEYRYKSGRVFLLRARIEPDLDGGYRVVKPGQQDSSFLASLAGSNAIILLPPDGGLIAPGEVRDAFWLAGAER